MALCIFIIGVEIKNLTRGKVSRFVFVGAALLTMLLLIYIIAGGLKDNAIYLRIIAVLNGKDGSFNYRYTRAILALKDIMDSTNMLGLGLGNLRTESTAIFLAKYGLLSFSNSYLFFIALSANVFVFKVYIQKN